MSKPKETFMQYQPRNPLPRRYSIAKVKRLYKEIYNVDVVKIDTGYKGNRHQLYEHYNVIDYSGYAIIENVTLNSLGDHLVNLGEY